MMLRSLALVFFILIAVVVGSVVSQTQPGLPFGVQFDDKTGNWAAQDFSSHFLFSQHLWRRDLPRPYTEAGHNEMMSRWLNRPSHGALPYGYTPTFALVLAPLLPLPALAAYVTWVMLPTFFWAVVLWTLSSSITPTNRVAALILGLAGISSSYLRGAQLGQTAAWCGAMLALIWLVFSRDQKSNWIRDWGLAFLIFLLTAKPPLAITAWLALWGVGERRSLGLAVALTSAWVVLVTAWLGTDWFKDYLYLLTHYNTQDAPPDLAISLEPIRMSNLRNVLFSLGWADGRWSSRWSSLGWVLSCGLFFLAVRKGRTTLGLSLALSLAIYEIFCPHLTFTEDVLIAVPVLWLATQSSARISAALWVLAGFIVMNTGPAKILLNAPAGAVVAFVIKCLLGISLVLAWFQSRRSEPPHEQTQLG
jgi:hypothetical protein